MRLFRSLAYADSPISHFHPQSILLLGYVLLYQLNELLLPDVPMVYHCSWSDLKDIISANYV